MPDSRSRSLNYVAYDAVLDSHVKAIVEVLACQREELLRRDIVLAKKQRRIEELERELDELIPGEGI